MRGALEAWGRLSRPEHDVLAPTFQDEVREALATARRTGVPLLAHGLGRSYGDVALNAGRTALRMPGLDRLIAVDWERGVVRAEAGMSLAALLALATPKGWGLPVTPGTKFVTLGGAIANDVHGKNHEHAGAFCAHVRALGLARSSGDLLTLEPGDPLFSATCAGLGLTGVIVWAELQLERIGSAYFRQETRPMRNLDDYFALANESRAWPYTVAWVDCLARGRGLGRGIYMRARREVDGPLTVHPARQKLAFPIEAPGFALNPVSIAAFNLAYRAFKGRAGDARVHYDGFYYPLDGVGGWNKLYGPRGFYQHQCALPPKAAPATLQAMLEAIAKAGEGSFLVVVKDFGDRPSPGLLSFPMEGTTLALDFPNKGESTRRLLDRLSDLVLAAGGRLYPAKDAVMRPDHFAASYPQWPRLEALRDPAIGSDFWRRVVGQDARLEHAA